MKKRFTIIYSIFAAVFILLSLTYLGYNLVTEYKEGISRTTSTFHSTTYNLRNNLTGKQLNNNDFSKKVIESIENIQDFSYFELKKNNQIVFVYPSNGNQINTKSNFTKYFCESLNIDQNNNYLLTCNIYLLRPYSIYKYSRNTFFMILGLTLLTILIIIISNIKTKSKNKLINTDSSILKNQEEIENRNKDLNENPDDDLIEDYSSEEEIISDNETNNPINENYNNIDTNEENQKEDNHETTKSIKKSEPEGLFSDTTGLGWESYLLTRLNNEINRAISTELDLALFVIKLTNLERTNPLTKKICDYITLQFQFRDLIFEYKENCIVIINTGENLDDALAFAEKIQNEITKMLENTDSKCFIGISTRSVRMISAESFLKEADEALMHAENDNNGPIIAFKANIEKYQKYLEQKFDD